MSFQTGIDYLVMAKVTNSCVSLPYGIIDIEHVRNYFVALLLDQRWLLGIFSKQMKQFWQKILTNCCVGL
jgi:hypothetical protein